MKIIKIGDKNYPKNLMNIYNPPKQLYVMGDEKILNEFGIGIVGTRMASEYGKKTTIALSYRTCKKGNKYNKWNGKGNR